MTTTVHDQPSDLSNDTDDALLPITGTQFAEIRRQSGMLQADFAELLGIDADEVRRLERSSTSLIPDRVARDVDVLLRSNLLAAARPDPAAEPVHSVVDDDIPCLTTAMVLSPYVFAAWLAKFRSTYRLTQLQVAQIVGISGPGLSTWERGVATPRHPETIAAQLNAYLRRLRGSDAPEEQTGLPVLEPPPTPASEPRRQISTVAGLTDDQLLSALAARLQAPAIDPQIEAFAALDHDRQTEVLDHTDEIMEFLSFPPALRDQMIATMRAARSVLVE